MARAFSEPLRPYTHGVTTLWYRAPELLLVTEDYGTAIDIWSIGCIFYEIVTKQPMFQGSSDLEQLNRIFRFMGTATECNWAGVTKTKNYTSKFPYFKQKISYSFFSEQNYNLCSVGYDLLMKLLRYNPKERIDAKDAILDVIFINLIPIAVLR